MLKWKENHYCEVNREGLVNIYVHMILSLILCTWGKIKDEFHIMRINFLMHAIYVVYGYNQNYLVHWVLKFMCVRRQFFMTVSYNTTQHLSLIIQIEIFLSAVFLVVFQWKIGKDNCLLLESILHNLPWKFNLSWFENNNNII